ncbi:hypothetical protein CcCBS67573_g03570 [Chytriomyces confervae]|uniref:G-protein coupled receptors family 1 profile domain-containing protein n=1 Tax=Chytriomyces confervae TaxID=246404 RepID=A0A507FHN4_9FUNG|nr:hypothetical protein CcCBS67573_g03570 [Chytriomyces confervae]
MPFNSTSSSFKVPTTASTNATFKHDSYENVEAVKNIISPSGDLTDVPFAIFPIYIPNFVGVVPIFLVGAFFNGFIMATILLNRKKLLVSRLDQFMFLLIFVFFLWSVACFVEFFANLIGISVHGYIAEAIISSFSIVMIFCVNLLLALERYFLIMSTPEYLCERIITGVIVLVGVLCGLILGIYVRTAIDMDHAELVESWSLTMYGALLLISTAVVVVYVRTYFRSSRLVRESLGLSKKKGLVARIRTNHKNKHGDSATGDNVSESESGGMDGVSVAIERRILFNSIIMASSLILCYLPGIILQVIPNVLHLSPEVAVFWSNVSEVSLSLDVLITPALILYFRRDIREVLLGFYVGMRQRVKVLRGQVDEAEQQKPKKPKQRARKPLPMPTYPSTDTHHYPSIATAPSHVAYYPRRFSSIFASSEFNQGRLPHAPYSIEPAAMFEQQGPRSAAFDPSFKSRFSRR